MQDVTSPPTFNENTGRNSRIEETDYEIQSKTTTPQIEKQPSQTKLLTVRPDPIVKHRVLQRPIKLSKYAPPVSDREGWWRTTIKDTPNPGTYDTHLNTFIKEIIGRPMTYGFKSDGRRRDPQPLEPKGKFLLPGAYTVENFVERMNQLRLSYGFKGPDRQSLLKQTIIDVPPGSYETQKYHTIDGSMESNRHSFFKSKITRKVFLPKLGPAPGDYEPKTNVTNEHSPDITSTFRSRTDRFQVKSSKVPGPGTYDQLITLPPTKQINNLSMRGVFLSSSLATQAMNSV